MNLSLDRTAIKKPFSRNIDIIPFAGPWIKRRRWHRQRLLPQDVGEWLLEGGAQRMPSSSLDEITEFYFVPWKYLVDKFAINGKYTNLIYYRGAMIGDGTITPNNDATTTAFSLRKGKEIRFEHHGPWYKQYSASTENLFLPAKLPYEQLLKMTKK